MTWKTIPSFPDYEITKDGLVRKKDGTVLKFNFSQEGYHRVCLKKGKHWFTRTVHQFVLEAFVGPRPLKHDACHIDGSKTNNNLSNLKWATRQENVNDSKRHGTYTRGTKQGACKLTEEQVIEIRNKYKAGFKCPELAKEYGISKANAYRVAVKISWQHVD